ncbi:MAG: MATE family efflux transporter, partial [Muribaculaceae bacterium]|nr:MATE family efflux transporter [Muribaculaceae bacterium]
MEKENFLKDSVLKIAAPITMQSIFQASFSVIDQIMTGQLGSVSVAGIGLGSKFASLYSVLLGAVVTAAGIMIAQYVGSRSKKGIQVSLFANMLIAALIAVIFTLLSVFLPGQIMSAYSADGDTVWTAAGYLRILSYGFPAMLIVQFLSMLLCSTNLAKLPMYGSILSIVLNIVLDYTLIFGKGGMPALGVAGAAWATTVARMVNALFLAACFLCAAGHES